jgi:CubicO group peptidase (beta-lactamase class C family)
MTRLSAILCGIVFVSNICGCSPATPNTLPKDVPTLLREYTDDYGFVGTSIGFIDQGKIEYFTYGKKAIHAVDPVTEDTIFEIGSITKVFTTLALVDMANKGIVQLDDPIEKYLPNVKIPGGEKITLRHLASHTSGLPRMPEKFNPKDKNNPYKSYTVDDLFTYLNHCTLLYEPGSSCEYSNIGMALLGQILSQQAGSTYDDMIQKRICEPLGMSQTRVSLTPEMSQNFASGHHLGQEVSHWDFPSLPGAGALRSNIKDMTCFLAANMGMVNSPLGCLMQQCHQKQYVQSPTFSIGLGWVLSCSNKAHIIWHDGGTGGFRSYLGFNPEMQRGVVILSNSTDEWPYELGFALLDPDYKPASIDKALANDPSYLNKFIGTYEMPSLAELPPQYLELSVYGKLLVLRWNPSGHSEEEEHLLYPESFGVFGVKGLPKVKAHFSFDAEKNVSNLKVFDENQQILLDAVPKNR